MYVRTGEFMGKLGLIVVLLVISAAYAGGEGDKGTIGIVTRIDGSFHACQEHPHGEIFMAPADKTTPEGRLAEQRYRECMEIVTRRWDETELSAITLKVKKQMQALDAGVLSDSEIYGNTTFREMTDKRADELRKLKEQKPTTPKTPIKKTEKKSPAPKK